MEQPTYVGYRPKQKHTQGLPDQYILKINEIISSHGYIILGGKDPIKFVALQNFIYAVRQR